MDDPFDKDILISIYMNDVDGGRMKKNPLKEFYPIKEFEKDGEKKQATKS
jgi:hypothetical protein